MKKRMLSVVLIIVLLVLPLSVTATPINPKMDERAHGEIVRVAIEFTKEPSVVDQVQDEEYKFTKSIEEDYNRYQDEIVSKIQKKIEGTIEIKNRFSVLTNGVVVEMLDTEIEKVKEVKGVKSVAIEPVFEVTKNENSKFYETYGNTTKGTTNYESYHKAINNSLDRYDGSKQIIAVIDSELNINHEAFANAPSELAVTREEIKQRIQTNNLHAKSYFKELSEGSYISDKIPFAFNYSEKKLEVSIPEYYHGSHVAGITCGNALDSSGKIVYQGVAPESQLLFFGIGHGSGVDMTCLVETLEDAYLLGADVINMSIGVSNGFIEENKFPLLNTAIPNLTKLGLNLSFSCGNEGSMSAGFKNPNLRGDTCDYSTIASPAVIKNGIAVGALAVIRQKLNDGTREKAKIGREAYNRLISTAVPLVNKETGTYYSIRKQGNGLVNVENALNTDVLVTVDSNVTARRNSCIANLGEDYERLGNYSFSFEIDNTSEKEKKYQIEITTLRRLVGEDNFVSAEIVEETKGVIATISGAMEANDGLTTLNIAPREKKKVTVTLQMTAEEKSYFETHYKNGSYIEGYFRLLPLEKDSVPITIGYLGYYGNLSDLNIFDAGTFYEPSEDTYFHFQDAIDNMEKGLGRNPYNETLPVSKEKIAISPGSKTGDSHLVQMDLCLLRNASTLMVEIYDKNKNLVFENSAENVAKSVCDTKNKNLSTVTFNVNFEGMTNEGEDLPDGDYTVVVKGRGEVTKSNDALEKWHEFSFPLKIDRMAPSIRNIEVRNINNKRYLVIQMRDNGVLAYASLARKNGDYTYLKEEKIIDHEKKVELQLEITDVFPSTMELYMEDYARNVTRVRFDLEEFLANNKLNFSYLPLEVDDSEQLFYMRNTIVDNQEITFRSINPEVASVDAFGNVTAIRKGKTKVLVYLKEKVIAQCDVVISEKPDVYKSTFLINEIPKEISVNSAIKIRPNNISTSSNHNFFKAFMNDIFENINGKWNDIVVLRNVDHHSSDILYFNEAGQYKIVSKTGNSSNDLQVEQEFTVNHSKLQLAYAVDAQLKAESEVIIRHGDYVPCMNDILALGEEKEVLTVKVESGFKNIKVNPQSVTSENEEIVAIKKEYGAKGTFYKMIAKGIGKTQLMVTADINGEQKETNVIVDVYNEPLDIKLNTRKLQLQKNDKKKITTEVIGCDGKEMQDTITYVSSDEQIATINKEGEIHAKVAGKCTIQIRTSNGQVAYVFIEVKESSSWKNDSIGWWYDYGNGDYPIQTWEHINKKYYYFGETGYMNTGWQLIHGKWYYLGKSNDGAMKTGWQFLNGAWYYLGDTNDGAMKTGWQFINGLWYYFGDHNDGAMKTGWIKTNEKWYFLNSNGDMAKNTWIGIYFVNNQGVWVN